MKIMEGTWIKKIPHNHGEREEKQMESEEILESNGHKDQDRVTANAIEIDRRRRCERRNR